MAHWTYIGGTRKLRYLGKSYRATGTMSGTSLDGIDVAMIETDGRERAIPGAALTFPYPPDFRERLRSVLGGVGPVAAIEAELTELHADAIEHLLREHGGFAIDIVGFHGHTICIARPKGARGRSATARCSLSGSGWTWSPISARPM